MRRHLGSLMLLALVACGQEASGIGQASAAVLGPQVQQVRASATGGDRAGAASQLAALRQSVADLRQRGELSEAGATSVLAAAAEVEAQLAATAATVPTTLVAPPAPVVTTAPTPDNGSDRPDRSGKPPKDDDEDRGD